jgi:hypothetical protein
MRETETSESFEGSGKLQNGDGGALEVSYSLSVIRTFIDTRTHDGAGQIPGSETIEGSISGLDEFTLLTLIGKPLTLVLQDGRRLNCHLKNPDGRIKATGGLLPSS